MKRVKTQPYSLTSKEPEASDAIGHYIFVIEVRRKKGITTYWLGYKYRAIDKVRPAGGGKWEGKFDFKHIAAYPPEGSYLQTQIQITDHAICEWLATKQPGMAQIPSSLVVGLDSLFSHGGRPFG